MQTLFPPTKLLQKLCRFTMYREFDEETFLTLPLVVCTAFGGAGHWSWQPIANPTPPEVGGEYAANHPIDRFVHALLEKEGIPPAQQASAEHLVGGCTLGW